MRKPTTKTCLRCEKTKHLSRFVTYDGGRVEHDLCGPCRGEVAREQAQAQKAARLAREAEQPGEGERRCTNCKHVKPEEEFEGPDGKVFRQCSDCRARTSKAYKPTILNGLADWNGFVPCADNMDMRHSMMCPVR